MANQINVIVLFIWKFFQTSKEQIMTPITDEIPKKEEAFAGSVKRYRPRV